MFREVFFPVVLLYPPYAIVAVEPVARVGFEAFPAYRARISVGRKVIAHFSLAIKASRIADK